MEGLGDETLHFFHSPLVFLSKHCLALILVCILAFHLHPGVQCESGPQLRNTLILM